VVVREGVKALVNAQSDMRIVGEASDGPTALDLVRELNPNVVVVEVSLRDWTVRRSRQRQARPDRKVMALTACEEREALRRLLEAGARGYVLKQASAEQLVRAIRTVAAGGSYIDPEMTGDGGAR
jgi:DNA-binding NarL/FixJ family response regulator